MVSPLASWFPDDRALARFRRRRLGRTPAILPPRDRAWRLIIPGFAECVAMARGGLPFQIVADRRVDRSGDPRRLAAALAAGETAYVPQVHQVLPRLTRLMVALRAALLGPGREESSFLFMVEGSGRRGMGLHHDGEVDAFWLQLEGRRTVTVGPRVRPGTVEDLDDRLARRGRRAGWQTVDLEPGSLFHLPARTPHGVVCRRRSLAVTLTWARAARPARGEGRKTDLLRWDVVSGFAAPIPRASSRTLWVQVPVRAERASPAAPVRVRTPDGMGPRLPGAARAWTDRLSLMPRLTPTLARAAGLWPLVDAGILGPRDLPLRIRPDDPSALDGWRFA
ncbi:MAG TPA: cupin domain-containing protein [Methylomirabilota bacterium]|jgi:mannose-6-phosphate isomerase-like protein (cupin superfamily)